eukprot:TRINITY_DN68423_c0_g1_i1.p1 TRINITY_DN68423_c0_g1~~TRINITY_DN68423_c0_g1_i1.p1  ORF type:complete len:225 (+),score=37.08 TRINITY_DN68423_c0_g1_i1:76-675(+)
MSCPEVVLDGVTLNGNYELPESCICSAEYVVQLFDAKHSRQSIGPWTKFGQRPKGACEVKLVFGANQDISITFDKITEKQVKNMTDFPFEENEQDLVEGQGVGILKKSWESKHGGNMHFMTIFSKAEQENGHLYYLTDYCEDDAWTGDTTAELSKNLFKVEVQTCGELIEKLFKHSFGDQNREDFVIGLVAPSRRLSNR